MSIGRRKKQVYRVCSFVKQSMCSRLLPAATKNRQQIEPLKKKCVQNFKALYSSHYNVIDSELVCVGGLTDK